VIPHETLEVPSTYGLIWGLFFLLVDKEIVLLWSLPFLEVVPQVMIEVASLKRLIDARDCCPEK
jgi:hypothetical protein